MILKKLKYKTNGEVESVWMMTQDQMQMMLNYAVNSLMEQGLAADLEVDEESVEEEAGEPEYEAMKEFLEQVKIKDLPQA